MRGLTSPACEMTLSVTSAPVKGVPPLVQWLESREAMSAPHGLTVPF